MLGEELAHPRVDIVRVNREAALGEKTRVNSRSCTEVEQLGAGRGNAKDDISKNRACAAIRLLCGDLTDILRARWSALKVSKVGLVATHRANELARGPCVRDAAFRPEAAWT